jgi:hypothetical protein
VVQVLAYECEYAPAAVRHCLGSQPCQARPAVPNRDLCLMPCRASDAASRSESALYG